MNIRMSTLRVGTLVVLASCTALVALAGPPNPGHGGGAATFTWRDAAGRPHMGDQAGIYIWHEGNTVFIASQSEFKKTTAIQAVDRNGRIVNVSRIHDERGDTISQPKDNTVIFKSRTYDGRDEMRFDVVNGKVLAVQIRQPNEHQRPIYVGGTELRTTDNRIAIRLP